MMVATCPSAYSRLILKMMGTVMASRIQNEPDKIISTMSSIRLLLDVLEKMAIAL